MKIFSLRDNPSHCDDFVTYFQEHWASPDSMKVYEDAITHAVCTDSRLPQWYLLIDSDKFERDRIVGCVGLIPNDFISRCDLYPWLCALYIDPKYRGQNLGSLLIERCREDAGCLGYENLYIATDRVGYYEHFAFEYIGTGYHPWGETSRIYVGKTAAKRKD